VSGARRRPGTSLLALLALLAIGLSQPWARDSVLAPARPASSFISGAFSYTNSAAGSAIFSTGALRPGETTTGTVTITNTGDLAGDFTLAQAGLVDTPGWNGGQLAPTLNLVIRDVTTSSPVTIYAGKLNGMGTRRVGRIDPGQARTYRFSMGLADGGAPPSNTTGDNVYQDAAVSVRYEWTGSELSPAPAPGPPPPGTTPPAGPGGSASAPEETVSQPEPEPEPEPEPSDAPSGDSSPPRVTFKVRRRQRLLRRRAVLAVFRCNEACKLKLTPRIRRRGRRPLKLRAVSRSLAAGKKTKVKLKLSRKARAVVALSRRKTITIVISIRAQDRALNAATLKRRARVKDAGRTKVRSGGRLRGR
jgi:hypothetical protein